jgi:single-strand DNA-binding protein
VNHSIIIGRLVRAPEVKQTKQSGHTFAAMTVAVNRVYKDKDGKKVEQADFVPVQVWGKLGDVCAEHLQQGQRVAVAGRLRFARYDDRGENRTYACLVASEVEFLDRARSSSAKSDREPAADFDPGDYAQSGDDDIPF